MKKKISFSLLCRWAFPLSQGGVAMHNKNLIETLLDSMNVKKVSLFHIENKAYFESIGVPFDSIKQPKNIPYFFLKFPIINNSYRFFIDKYISDKMSNLILLNKPDIVEFMDINSEAFSSAAALVDSPYSPFKNWFFRFLYSSESASKLAISSIIF